MNSSVKTILLCIILAAARATRVDAENSADATSSQPEPMLQAETGMPESSDEVNSDWLEAHESNGPEGTHGVPMQKISRFQFGLVLLILVTSGGLACSARTKRAFDHE